MFGKLARRQLLAPAQLFRVKLLRSVGPSADKYAYNHAVLYAYLSGLLRKTVEHAMEQKACDTCAD
jgi:hypothetical protein